MGEKTEQGLKEEVPALLSQPLSKESGILSLLATAAHDKTPASIHYSGDHWFPGSKLQSLVSQVLNGFWHNVPTLMWGAGDVGGVGTFSLCAVAS